MTTLSKATDQNFIEDVLKASLKTHVLVHFKSAQSQHCQNLSQNLLTIASETGNSLRILECDINTSPMVASQLHIQMVPTLYLFSQGQPIDAIAGPIDEDTLKQFLERHIHFEPSEQNTSPEETIKEAESALKSKDFTTALTISQSLINTGHDLTPQLISKTKSIAITALIHMNALEEAQAILESPDILEEDRQSLHHELTKVITANQLIGQIDTLTKETQENPHNYQSFFNLALARNQTGHKELASDALLHIVKHDRSWNDDGARKQLVEFFKDWGDDDEVTQKTRRKLSSLLFS